MIKKDKNNQNINSIPKYLWGDYFKKPIKWLAHLINNYGNTKLSIYPTGTAFVYALSDERKKHPELTYQQVAEKVRKLYNQSRKNIGLPTETTPSLSAAGLAIAGGAFSPWFAIPDIVFDVAASIDEPSTSNNIHTIADFPETVAKFTPSKIDDYVAKGVLTLGNIDDAVSTSGRNMFSNFDKKPGKINNTTDKTSVRESTNIKYRKNGGAIRKMQTAAGGPIKLYDTLWVDNWKNRLTSPTVVAKQLAELTSKIPIKYLGGNKDNARKEFWKQEPVFQHAVDSIANQYGISPESLKYRLDREGFTDYNIKRRNTKIKKGHQQFEPRGYKLLNNSLYKLAGTQIGLDDAKTYIDSGRVKLINEKWFDLGTFKNEKGRITYPVEPATLNDGMGIVAAHLKYFRDKALLDFPNASEYDLDRYANAYYNRGALGGKKWVLAGAKGYNYRKQGGKMNVLEFLKNGGQVRKMLTAAGGPLVNESTRVEKPIIITPKKINKTQLLDDNLWEKTDNSKANVYPNLRNDKYVQEFFLYDYAPRFKRLNNFASKDYVNAALSIYKNTPISIYNKDNNVGGYKTGGEREVYNNYFSNLFNLYRPLSIYLNEKFKLNRPTLVHELTHAFRLGYLGITGDARFSSAKYPIYNRINKEIGNEYYGSGYSNSEKNILNNTYNMNGYKIDYDPLYEKGTTNTEVRFRLWKELYDQLGRRPSLEETDKYIKNYDGEKLLRIIKNANAYGQTMYNNGMLINLIKNALINVAQNNSNNTYLLDDQTYYAKQGGILKFLKNGSGIHIKEKNKGKFTSYCGGKVTDECILKGKNSSNPAIRKRATFVANARKWKHENGGIVHNGIKKHLEGAKLTFGLKLGNLVNSDLGKSFISNGLSFLSDKLLDKLFNKNASSNLEIVLAAQEKELPTIDPMQVDQMIEIARNQYADPDNPNANGGDIFNSYIKRQITAPILARQLEEHKKRLAAIDLLKNQTKSSAVGTFFNTLAQGGIEYLLNKYGKTEKADS